MDDGPELTIQWVPGDVTHEEEVSCYVGLVAQDDEVIGACEEVYEEGEPTITTLDTARANLPPETEIVMVTQENHMEPIFLVPQDQTDDYLNIQNTEEVITDNWDRGGPDDGIEIPETKVSHDNLLEYDDMEIPLPIDQDSYINTRPHPCDFCTRRFRKKANLMNHMVAHQTDHKHGCNICGVRFARKDELMDHQKCHAYAPSRDILEDDLNDDDLGVGEEEMLKGRRKKVQSAPPRKRQRTTNAVAKRNITIQESSKMSKSFDYAEDIPMMDEMSGRGPSTGKGNFASSSKWTDSMIAIESTPTRWPITDPTKPYVCQYCGVGFAREKALASHSRIHGSDSPYECTNCGESIWDQNAFREHMKVKHGMTHAQPEEFDAAETSYTGDERLSEYYCEICGVPFHRLDLLKRHRKIHIKQEIDDSLEDGLSNQHVCNVCGEGFGEALRLLAHAEIHTRSPSRRCLLCGKRCSDDAEVAEHVRQYHAEDAPPNTCEQCGKTCKDKRSLVKHSWVHNVDKTFGCTKCGKRFHSKARLRRHMMSHRNKMVACDECGEEFPDGRALVSHRHSHNKDSGGRTFPCRECGKSFGSRSSQQIHIRIHTGERPYGCRFCWKAFADGGTLRKHERIHTGEKPYGCAICPRAFNQRVVLREHVRAHHSGPDPKFHGSVTPYMCKVCGDAYATSEEIVLHIVSHCDQNTALRRQPQIGPRKYKRRRKLKPHESPVSVLAPQSNENYNVMETASDSDDNTKRKLGKKNKQLRSNAEEDFPRRLNDVLKCFDSPLQNFDSLVNSKSLTSQKNKAGRKKIKKEEKKIVETPPQTTTGRPKMIHTQKTRVPVESGSEGAKKGQKTKTMVTRTPKVLPNEHKQNIFAGGERNRPRTKNVSYHVDGKFQYTPATFSKPTEPEVEPPAEQPTETFTPVSIKVEGLNRKVNHENNNGNIENVNTKPAKKKPAPRSRVGGRRSARHIVIKQEPADDPINEDDEIATQLETSTMIIDQSEVHHNLAAAFDSSVHASDETEEVHEAILPDLDNVNHTEEISNNKMKLSVTVESRTQRLLQSVSEDVPETIIPDTVEYTCEMCSEVFATRAELLIHVPIHI